MTFVAFMDGAGKKISDINDIIFDWSSSTLWTIFGDWPNIVWAIWILLIWWLFSAWIEKVLTNVVNRLKVDTLFNKFHFQDILDKAQIRSSPVIIVVKFLKGYIFMMFFLAAARLLSLDYIADFLNSVINFLPKLAVTLLIVLVWFSIADTTANFLRNTLKIADIKSAILLSSVAKYVIITFTVLAALMQIEIAPNFLYILFVWVVSALSLWIWLAFWIWWSKFISHRLEEFANSQYPMTKAKRKTIKK